MVATSVALNGGPVFGIRGLSPLTIFSSRSGFAASASTAQGTDLRAGRFSDLTDLIDERSRSVEKQEREAAKRVELSAKVKAGIERLGTGPDARVEVKLYDARRVTGYAIGT